MEQYRPNLPVINFYYLLNRILLLVGIINNIVFQKEILFVLAQLILLFMLTLEDEKNMEVSVEVLITLFINNIFIIISEDYEINIKVIIFSFLLYLFIYFLSKKSIGIGDLVLNIILSISYKSIFSYYIFFTLSFALGAVYSIYKISFGNLNSKSTIPFIKFIVMAYIITILMRWLYG